MVTEATALSLESSGLSQGTKSAEIDWTEMQTDRRMAPGFTIAGFRNADG
jgi:hypothetical protein